MDKLNTSSNASSTSWISNMLFEEIDIEGCGDLFQQCEQNLFGDEDFLSHDIASVLQQDEILLEQQQPLLSSESYYSIERPNKKLKTNTTIFQDVSPVSSPSSITSQILSFDYTLNTKKQNEVVVPLSSQKHVQLPQNRKGSLQNKNQQGQGGTKRSGAHNQDHIIAERKRREKLSQCLIALAALIPGLKKMDKASVLGDAVKYVKELQKRLRVLEEKNKNSSTSPPPVECVVTVNNGPQISNDSSSNDESEAEDVSGNNEILSPHVEARILDKDVLIRIHCKKQKGFLLKVLFEIQKLHLFVVNSSVLPFGDSILDITIVAQMGKGFKLTRNELIKSIQQVAALRSMS